MDSVITLDDIAGLPHGEGKAIALSLWKRLQIIDRALHEMCDTFEYSAPNGDVMYKAFVEWAESQPVKSSTDNLA
jgi:hypothetical protein